MMTIHDDLYFAKLVKSEMTRTCYIGLYTGTISVKIKYFLGSTPGCYIFESLKARTCKTVKKLTTRTRCM